MADFFTRLAERTLGTVPVAQPLLTPMFAAPVLETMPLNDIEFAADSGEATLTVQKPARPLAQTPTPSRPEASPQLEPFPQSSVSHAETLIGATPPSATDALVEESRRIEPDTSIEQREIVGIEQGNDERASENTGRPQESPLHVGFHERVGETLAASPFPLEGAGPSVDDEHAGRSQESLLHVVQPLVPSPKPFSDREDMTLPAFNDIQVSVETDIRQELPPVQSQNVLPFASSKPASEAFVHEESVEVTPSLAQPLVSRQGVPLSTTPQQREALIGTTVDGGHEIGDMHVAKDMIAAPRSALSETDNLIVVEHVTRAHNEIVLERTHLAMQEETIQQSQAVVIDAIEEFQQRSVAAEHREGVSTTLVPQEHVARRQSESPLRESVQAFPHQVPPHELPTEAVVQPPTIHISIGRIEVRAVTPPTVSTRPKPRRAEPTLSLEDYLKQARGGRS